MAQPPDAGSPTPGKPRAQLILVSPDFDADESPAAAEVSDAQDLPNAPDSPSAQIPPMGAGGETRVSERVAYDGPRSGGRRVPLWLLLAIVVPLVWVLAQESLRSSRLAETVAVLEADLAVSEAALGAHRARLEQIRTRVDALASEFGALQPLVHFDPAVPPRSVPRPE